MAKILYTAVVADMRGKLNGNVMSKNRAGNFIRTKVSPINQQTPAQTAARQRLAAFTTLWRGLTQAQRDSWITAADSTSRTDVFGNTRKLSGIQLYTGTNQNLVNIGLTPITSAPVPGTFPSFVATFVTMDVSANQVQLALTAGVPVGYSLIVMATGLLSPGRNFFKGQYRQIAVANNTATVPLDLFAAYTNKFGSLVAGRKVSFMVWLINEATGEAGVPSSVETIIIP